ncbi:hypothetical protein CAEBREN_18663 [Caenorhabditis brenneri]|uniref:Uncharacterized protein n=1 Tax=Caenorhabditis brenneri TaxID=135651 RepID=G0PCN9_CAEBE|nr:hypothetical protein CAEBREN_18663 [Caenorhabditis brenneri]
MSSTRTYPSLRQLADQFSQTPEYAPLRVPKLDRARKPMQNNPGFPKVNPIEMKREPIKITPLSDEEYNRITRQRVELERARLKMAQEIDDSDDSDDSSTSSSSDASVSPHKSSSDTEIEEKKPTFLDILKSSKALENKSETPILPSSLGSLGGLEFLGNPAPKAWGPSKSGLVTDDVAPTSDSLASLAHLPSLSMNRPTLKTAKSEDIDALFEEDMAEYLGDFSDFSDGEKTPKAEVERKSPEKIVVEKPVNVVPPVVKKEEPMQVEPVVLSEEDSIDELDDFDTADLSSGGSDFSF